MSNSGEITAAVVSEYVEKYTSPQDELLQEVWDYTVKNYPNWHMMSGHLQGKFLEMVSCMLQPQNVLEIGTFTGYSALCLAKGLKMEGKLHTIEVREEDALRAQSFFNKSGEKEKIIIHVGNALTIIDEIDSTWDLVFIDADKENYIRYFNLVFPKVRQNGFILADNTLFHGQVLEREIKGKTAKAIQAFNDFIRARTDIEKVMLPLRDGLFLIRKL